MRLLSNPRDVAISLFLTAILGAGPAFAGDFTVFDTFGRVLNGHGVTLVDWEGPIANPAVRLVVRPPAGAAFPLDATLSADNQRLYFDLPSTWGADGPTRAVTFATSASSAEVYLAVFGDADSLDEDYTLTISGGPGADTTIPIHVTDQDRPSRESDFQVLTNFGQDQTGFFDDAANRAVIEKASGDWAYYVADMGLDPVAAGDEFTFIWDPDGFVSGQWVLNDSSYVGYLLYAYGIHSSELRSGGEPSSGGGFQSSGGTSLDIRRSGGTEIETAGNYNTLGWFVSTDPDDWWVSGNFGDEQNDLFSIAHHEIGHSLAFNPANPRFADMKSLGYVDDPAVLAYHGVYPTIDAADHLDGSIDNASRKGAFGYEFYGSMPARRWVITKLDLLCVQAIGYTLRDTSPFEPLQVTDSVTAHGMVGVPYADTLRAAGGIPAYNWTVASGALPGGLSLDPWSGVLAGTPEAAGTFHVSVQVEESDSSGTGVTVPVTVVIDAASSVAGATSPAFSLEAAGPNPFRSSLMMRFSLRRDGFASLALFDVTGKRVRIAASGRYGAGEHLARVDAGGLAPGVYMCRLTSGDDLRVVRIVLVR